MDSIVKKAESQLKDRLLKAVKSAIDKDELQSDVLPEFDVEVPNDRSHGDYSTNIALASARIFHKAPRQIAEIILNELSLEETYFTAPEIAGAGFINFTLSDSYYADVVKSVLEQKDDYGKSDMGKGKKVMVEFVSANPTGPMHIGNARGGALGDCLSSVLDYAGYDVTREFYVNDAGNQIEKFAQSLNARYLQIYLGEEAIQFPEDGYHGDDIKDRAKEFAEINGDKYVSADETERKNALVDYALEKNISALKTDLERYRIYYDVWFRESTLHGAGGEIEETIQILKDKGLTYEKDGKLWYKTTAMGGEKDDCLIRENGKPTYFAADIAYHRNKLYKRGFDWAINVWGADHHGHVARLKGTMDAVGLDGNNLDVVLMQLVRLVKNGETVKVSKRTGKAISLNNLLDEIPLDAARFFFNMREPNTHLEFDLGLAVEQSSQNPVYYVQYAHARICSILKKLKEEGISTEAVTGEELKLLCDPTEHELIRYIASLEQVVEESVKALDPSKITRYAIELSTLFHKFYNACRVNCDDENLMKARISLVNSVKILLVNLLGMLNINCPESM